MKLTFVMTLFTIFFINSVIASVFVKENFWPKSEIRTCFGDEEKKKRSNTFGRNFKPSKWKNSEKRKVQNWIEEEYNNLNFGIQFVGWLDCSQMDHPDLVVFIQKNNLSGFFSSFGGTVNKVGYHSGVIEGFPTAGNFVAFNRSAFSKGLVLHEFGHVLGLGHEHSHPNAYGSCHDINPEKWRHELLNYTEFDRDSIMSYCNVLNSSSSVLSTGDLEALKILYLNH